MTHPDVLVEGLRCAPGKPFFRWLVTRLREALDVQYVFIGEFTGDDATRVHVLATSEDTADIDHRAYVYELEGTAAAGPPDADGLHWYPRDVHRRFPHVQIYQALGIESLACLRLMDAQGRPLGLLCVLDTKPFAAPVGLRRILLGLRARTAGDLELCRVQRERQLFAETAAAARTRDVLPQLVEQLARALDVRRVFVSTVLDEPPTRARTLAVWDAGRLVPNCEYALAGTPCALVYERDVVVYPRDLQRYYPRNRHLVQTGAQAYLGMALHDRHGRPIGHLGILHDRPLHEGLATVPLLHVMALLAGKELDRVEAPHEAGKPNPLAAGEVAHDFNNLLAGILAHSGLALDELTAPDAVRARLQAIQSTAQRAADLARDMLDAPATETAPDEAIDVGALARDTASLLGPTIPPQVRIEFEDEPALPPVRGNPTQLRQIVMNLLLNATEAIGDRAGRIQVRLGRGDTAATNGPGPRLVLTVTDTGVGMTTAAQARIFEPAFTTKTRGRGIGLAIVRKLVERHDGTITVESTPRVGTRFTVIFPGVEATVPTTAPAMRIAPVPILQQPVRALLVDDDEGVRVTTAHMLRRLGCDVVTANDGDAALVTLDAKGAQLDLVLLDMAMPGLSGEELVLTLRRSWPTLPIIVMSGYATPQLARRLGQHSALRFLQKPFGLDALRTCLANVTTPAAEPTAMNKPARARA